MARKSRLRSYHVHLQPDRLHQILLKLLVKGGGNQDAHGSTVASVNHGGPGCRPAIAPLHNVFGTFRMTVAACDLRTKTSSAPPDLFERREGLRGRGSGSKGTVPQETNSKSESTFCSHSG